MTRLYTYYIVKQTLKFAPCPLFLLGFIYSLFASSSICGLGDHTMSVMWALMALAHALPYVAYWEVRGCPKGCGCHAMLD